MTDASGITDLLRPDLRGKSPYGAPQIQVPCRLNVNENPYPPSKEMVEAVALAVAKETTMLNRYPDRDAIALRQALVQYVNGDAGVDFDYRHVWAANGSNEVMLELMQAFGGPGKKALTFSPTYSMYPDYCRDTFTEFVAVPRREDFSVDMDLILDAISSHQPDVLLFASPNNPTGTALDPRILEQVYDAFDGLVIVDEAYAEFRRPQTRSALSFLHGRPRLVVTRTMSKAFALAGARVGYLIADPAVVDAVQLVRLPYHLSATTQAVARTALQFAADLLSQVKQLRESRDDLVEWLASQGFDVADSDANFVMFGRFADTHQVWQSLLDQGVLIRETGPRGWLRVSIGTPEEMASFKQALMNSTKGTA